MFLPAFFLVATLFFILVLSALLFPFLLQESFVNVFSKCILPKIASLLLFVVYYKCFFAIFYFCCDFVFIIVNADVTFSFFSVKVCSNAFFCHKLLFFVVFIKMFLPAFFSCCNFVFYSCKICVTFPLLLQKDFWLIFQPHFHRKLLTFCLFAAFR